MATTTRAARAPRNTRRKKAEDFSWMHHALEIAPVGVYRCDPAGVYIYVNERWRELTGWNPKDVVGTSSGEHVHPEDRERLRFEWERTAAKGLPFRHEYRYLRPDGSIRWILGRITAAYDDDGNVLEYVGTATDITELRLAREEVERARNELETRVRERTRQLHEVAIIFEQSNDAIISSDMAGHVISWNRAAERLYRYTAEEAMGMPVLNFTPSHDRAATKDIMARVRAGETVTNFETVRVAKGGISIEVSLSLFPLREEDGTIFGTCAIVRDISEKKKTERQLQQLTQRLHNAHDEQRRRIARDLHDSTAQVLAALTMNLAALGRPIDLATHHRLLDDSVALAQQVVRELRTQSYLLHPPLLDEHGFTAVLRCFVEGFTARSGIPVELDLPADFPRLPEEREAALFRVAQESLANVHRHSESPNARIALRIVNRAVELTVRDFGRGLARGAAKIAGVGVAGMKERLKQLGGSLFIARAKPGTCVVAMLPLDRPKPSHFMTTPILLVDDHEIVRRGLRALLETRTDFTVCDETGDGRTAVELAKTLHPDVVVMDVNLPLLNGIEATRQIRQRWRTAEVLMLSMHESEDVVRDAIAAGARGFVFKSDAARDLIAAVDTVRAGRTFFTARTATVAHRSGAGGGPATPRPKAVTHGLTRRETEVLQLLAEGRTNKSVADLLKISVKTVETHRARIMRKLRLGSIAELVRYALRNRIITDT